MKRYYSTQRPIAPGTFPKPEDNKVIEVHNFDNKEYVGNLGRSAWGYIDYERALTENQACEYELVSAESGENKAEICKMFCKVLQKTRDASDLLSLEYDGDKEIVWAMFEGGTRRINVAMDSGTAMIRDIMNYLGC